MTKPDANDATGAAGTAGALVTMDQLMFVLERNQQNMVTVLEKNQKELVASLEKNQEKLIAGMMEKLGERDAQRDKEREAREIKRDEEREAREKMRDEEREAREIKRDEEREAREKMRDEEREERAEKRHEQLVHLFSSQNDSQDSPDSQNPAIKASVINTISKSRVTDVECTPRKVRTKPTKVDTKHYVDLASQVERHVTDLAVLSSIWKYVGGGAEQLSDTADAKQGIFTDGAVSSILARYRGIFAENNASFNMAAETSCQKAVNSLFAAVEEQIYPGANAVKHARYYDRHNRPIPGGTVSSRKPDGIITTESIDAKTLWLNTVATIEIKHCGISSDDPELQGQIYQAFLDMANYQPRRRMLGIAFAKDREVYMYVYTPYQIFKAMIGCYPHPCHRDRDRDDDDGARVIRALLMVYQALTADYGFMVPGRAGLHCDFPLSTIQDSTPSDTNVYTESAMVTAAKVPLGRHSELFGARSWVFSAMIREPGCVATACFLKFVWSPKKMSEIDAHKGIIDMGAPYVPELLYSATIRVSANAKDIEGAVLAVDMAGQPINACFASVANSSAWHIVDIFAGYVHTLLAASTASDRCMILHRDVSTGNLLVGPRYKPCLIDWGMGVVLARSNDAHIPSPEALVGTAIYMSVRVLKGCGRRSVIDDLESMFLVYSRCLWNAYGRGKSLGALWSSQEKLDTVLITRMYWLTSERVYIAEMDLSECPHALEVLAREFYRLLFPAAIDMANIVRSRHDPRLRDFNADGWVSAFKRALCAEQTHSTVVATCVDKLVEYFDKLDCPIAGTIAPPGSSPQLHDLAAHLTIQQPSLHSTDLGAAWDEAERPYTPTHAPKEAHARQRDNMNRRPDDAEDPDSPDNMSRLRRLRHRASRGTYNFFKNASPKHRKK